MKMANDSYKSNFPPLAASPPLLPLYNLFFSRDMTTTFASRSWPSTTAIIEPLRRRETQRERRWCLATLPRVENVRKGVSDLTTPQHEGENNGDGGEREERQGNKETHA